MAGVYANYCYTCGWDDRVHEGLEGLTHINLKEWLDNAPQKKEAEG